jgi:VWFA-related protein
MAAGMVLAKQRTCCFIRIVLFGAALLLLACVFTLAQDRPAPFTIKVNTRLVVQTVSVTDKSGKPIEGLSRDDFILTEGDVLQTISVFEFEKLDDSAPQRPGTSVSRPAADVAREPVQPLAQTRISPVAPGDSRYQDKRLLALYFDLPALRADADRIRAFEGALTYVDNAMTSADIVAILTYKGEGVRVLQDFTDDRNALREILSALRDGTDLDDYSFTFGQESGEFALFNTDRQLAALQTAVKMLGVLNEKKSLIDFTTRINVAGVDNQSQLRATLNAARRANVSLYPVDSRGLIAMAPMGDASERSPGGLGMYNGATAMRTMGGISRSQDALYTLAADTGGKPLVDYNDLSMGIVNAQRANSSYYILGYYATNTATDGKLRRVRITLKSNSDAKLAYRESYYADKEFTKFSGADKERQLEEALMLGDPITELPIVMEINYFQLNKAEYFVPLAVKISGSELVLAQKAGAEQTLIDFIGEIRNEYGTIIANIRDKADFKTKGEAASVLARSPIQYDAGFTLIPGKYTIKFLARNAETGRIGTYQADFVVPNLNKELLHVPISSVVLGNQRVPMREALFNAGKTKEAKAQIANPLIEDGVKLLPSVTRSFQTGQELYVYLQAYEREAETTEPLVVFATFFRGANRVLETKPVMVTAGMDPKSKAVPIKLTIPLKSLEDGEYVFQITVLDSTNQKIAFWQSSIRIDP